MSLLDSFPHLCTISKRTRSKGNSTTGGSVDATPAVQTGVECWEQQLSSKEILEFQKRELVVSRKVYFLADPGIGTKNLITITSRDGLAIPEASQIPMDVVGNAQPDASAGLGVVYRVYVAETTGDGI